MKLINPRRICSAVSPFDEYVVGRNNFRSRENFPPYAYLIGSYQRGAASVRPWIFKSFRPALRRKHAQIG